MISISPYIFLWNFEDSTLVSDYQSSFFVRTKTCFLIFATLPMYLCKCYYLSLHSFFFSLTKKQINYRYKFVVELYSMLLCSLGMAGYSVVLPHVQTIHGCRLFPIIFNCFCTTGDLQQRLYRTDCNFRPDLWNSTSFPDFLYYLSFNP